jgi:hypothetical protein
MAKKSGYFSIRVEYHGTPDTEVDQAIRSIASDDNHMGSGYGFGIRDIGFTFTKQKDFADSFMSLAKLIKMGFEFDVTTNWVDTN